MVNANKKTILIVEDNILFATTLSHTLQTFGYDTIIASSGEEAVETILQKSKINLVLMDFDLGKGMDGAETAKKILETQLLPIVFHTAFFAKEIMERVKSITRYGYIVKNSGEFVLKSTLDVALDLFDTHQKNIDSLLLEYSRNEASNLFHTVVENIPNMIFIKHARTLNFAMFNRAGETLLGANRKDLIGKNDYDFFPKEQADFFTSNDRNVLANGEVIDIPEETIATPNGIRILHTKKLPLLDELGNPQYLLGISEDITDRKKAEKRVKEMEAEFKNMFENHNAVMLLIEPDTGLILDANKAACKFYGYPELGLSSKSINEINTLPPEKIFEERQRAILENKNYFIFHHKLANGEQRVVEVHSSPILFKGEIVLFSIIHDITNRRNAEEKIQSLLAEKELLLQEVHHRIKNNMLTITSLLYLQTENLKDPTAIAALNDASSRIRSMLILYDKLYRSTEFKELSVQEYLSTLIDEIVINFPNHGIVKVKKTIENFVLAASILFPIGIMINELITNAMKYAFKERNSGVLEIITAKKNENYLLTVRDDGIGIPDSIDLESSPGFGLQLVKMLARQLKGTINLERKKGTSFTLQFEEE